MLSQPLSEFPHQRWSRGSVPETRIHIKHYWFPLPHTYLSSKVNVKGSSSLLCVGMCIYCMALPSSADTAKILTWCAWHCFRLWKRSKRSRGRELQLQYNVAGEVKEPCRPCDGCTKPRTVTLPTINSKHILVFVHWNTHEITWHLTTVMIWVHLRIKPN